MLDAPFVPLVHPIFPKGYDGASGKAITHVILFNMLIDGYLLKQQPFLVLDLGNQDAILGDGWMDYYDVLPDMRNRRLV